MVKNLQGERCLKVKVLRPEFVEKCCKVLEHSVFSFGRFPNGLTFKTEKSSIGFTQQCMVDWNAYGNGGWVVIPKGKIEEISYEGIHCQIEVKAR